MDFGTFYRMRENRTRVEKDIGLGNKDTRNYPKQLNYDPHIDFAREGAKFSIEGREGYSGDGHRDFGVEKDISQEHKDTRNYPEQLDYDPYIGFARKEANFSFEGREGYSGDGHGDFGGENNWGSNDERGFKEDSFSGETARRRGGANARRGWDIDGGRGRRPARGRGFHRGRGDGEPLVEEERYNGRGRRGWIDDRGGRGGLIYRKDTFYSDFEFDNNPNSEPQLLEFIEDHVDTNFESNNKTSKSQDLPAGSWDEYDYEYAPQPDDVNKKEPAKEEAENIEHSDLQSNEADQRLSSGADPKPSSGVELKPLSGGDLRPSSGADLKLSSSADLRPSSAEADPKPSSGADLRPSSGAELKPSFGAYQKPLSGADLRQSPEADQKPSSGADQKSSSGTHSKPPPVLTAQLNKKEDHEEIVPENIAADLTYKEKKALSLHRPMVDEAALQLKLNVPGKTTYYCQYCNVNTCGRPNFVAHIRGKQHNLNLNDISSGDKTVAPETTYYRKKDLGKYSFLEVALEDQRGDEVIVGMSCLTEYQSIVGQRCICNVCGSTFPVQRGFFHLIGFQHRLHYIKLVRLACFRSFGLFKGSKNALLCLMIPILKEIEDQEGSGKITISVFEDALDLEPDRSAIKSLQGQLELDMDRETLRTAFIRHTENAILVTREKIDKKRKNIFVDEQETYMDALFLRRSWTVKKVPVSHGEPPLQERHLRHRHHHPASPPPLSRLPYAPPPPPQPHHRDPYRQRPSRNGPYHDRAYAYPPFDMERRRRLKNDEYPEADPEKSRRSCAVPYLDPDPLNLKRILPVDSLYAAKRPKLNEPYIDPDPLKRVLPVDSLYAAKLPKLNEPYIDPDPLKRILPSQRAANKPVVIDYGHGSEKKSAKATADEWEKDMKDIFKNESKATDSLAQLNSSYSSPKRESTPPRDLSKRESSALHEMPKRKLPFAKSYIERSKVLQHESRSSKTEAGPNSSPRREDSRKRNKTDSRDIKHWRSPSPDDLPHRGRYKHRDSTRKTSSFTSKGDGWASPSRRYAHSRSPQRKDMSSRKSKRHSRSPETSTSKSAFQNKEAAAYTKKRHSRSPDKDNATPYSKKVETPYSRAIAESRKVKIEPAVMIDLTSDDEMTDPTPLVTSTGHPTRKENMSSLTGLEKAPITIKEPESSTSGGNNVDDAQVDLIAEMLLNMKSSIIKGQEADPQAALKALLASNKINEILLAAKDTTDKDPQTQTRLADRRAVHDDDEAGSNFLGSGKEGVRDHSNSVNPERDQEESLWGYINHERSREESLQGHINPERGREESLRGHVNPERSQEESLRGHVNPERSQEESLRGHINPERSQEESLWGYINPERNQEESLQGHINPERGREESLWGHVNPERSQEKSLRGHVNPERGQVQEESLRSHVNPKRGREESLRGHVNPERGQVQEGSLRSHVNPERGREESLRGHVNPERSQEENLRGHINPERGQVQEESLQGHINPERP